MVSTLARHNAGFTRTVAFVLRLSREDGCVTTCSLPSNSVGFSRDVNFVARVYCKLDLVTVLVRAKFVVGSRELSPSSQDILARLSAFSQGTPLVSQDLLSLSQRFLKRLELITSSFFLTRVPISLDFTFPQDCPFLGPIRLFSWQSFLSSQR